MGVEMEVEFEFELEVVCGLKVEEDVVLELGLEEEGFLIESLVRSEDGGPTNIDDDEACEA